MPASGHLHRGLSVRFVFVHGGFHAAWCWDRVLAELADLGHDGVAVDLPGHGALVRQDSTLANRRDAIVAAMQPGDVLVGHSGGGFDQTLAADARPDLVKHIIYSPPRCPPAKGVRIRRRWRCATPRTVSSTGTSGKC